MRGCAGKTTGSSIRPSPSTIRASRSGCDVRLAVDGRDDVAAGLERRAARGCVDRSRAIGREADSTRRPSRRRRPRSARRRPRAASVVARALVRGRAAARRPGRPRSGSAPPASTRSPLRRPGLDVRDADADRDAPRARPRASSSCRRRRAPSRAARRSSAATDPGQHRVGVGACARSSRYAGSASPSSSKKTSRQLRGRSAGPCAATTSSIPASRSASESGAGLDELRPVADDGENLHGATKATMAAARAVSSVGRAGDS